MTVGHDWGGVISLGWALAHRDRVRAVVLANTAVHQPADAAAPSLIRLARTPALRHAICTATPHVRPRRLRPLPARPARRRARRPRRAVRHGGQAARRRRVRRRHPARSRARQRADAGRHRRGSPGAGRRARADAVGAPRPGLLRPLPARPARAAAARARPPLRAGLAPRHRGRSRQRGRRLALAAEPGRGSAAAGPASCRPAAGLGRVGGARGRPGTPPWSSSRTAAAPSRSTCWSGGCASSPRVSLPPVSAPGNGWRCSCRPEPT